MDHFSAFPQFRESHTSDTHEVDDIAARQPDHSDCSHNGHHWEVEDPTGWTGFFRRCWRCGAEESLSPEEHKAMALDWQRQQEDEAVTLKATWGAWAALVVERHPETTAVYIIRPQSYAHTLGRFDHPVWPIQAFVQAEGMLTGKAWNAYLLALRDDEALTHDQIVLYLMDQSGWANPLPDTDDPWADAIADRDHEYGEMIPTWDFSRPYYLRRKGAADDETQDDIVFPEQTGHWAEDRDLIQIWPIDK